MADTYMEQTAILRQEWIAPDIYSLWIRTEHIAAKAAPGQFLSVYCDDPSRMLPRPLSLCETDGADLRLVYRVAGDGTREFSEKQADDTLRVLGPLGNGFPLQTKPALVIGGGIGIPPMLELARRYPGQSRVVLGYNDSHTFLAEEFTAPVIATMDGSVGTRGTVLDAVAAEGLAAEVIYACGPAPMLRAVREYAIERDMECWVSLEERMACGIGACLACVCPSTGVDDHSKVKNKRVCKDGPVFNAREIAWDDASHA